MSQIIITTNYSASTEVQMIGQVPVGDIVSLQRKDNTTKTISFKAVDEKKDEHGTLVHFLAEQTIGHSCMCDELRNYTWESSDLRRKLQDMASNIIPDEIQEMITERTITQHIDEKLIVTKDKFWIPSLTDLGIPCNSDEGDTQFIAIQTEYDRVRPDENGYTDWYWSRSRSASNGTRARGVYAGGSGSGYSVSSTGGVLLGFSIYR